VKCSISPHRLRLRCRRRTKPVSSTATSSPRRHAAHGRLREGLDFGLAKLTENLAGFGRQVRVPNQIDHQDEPRRCDGHRRLHVTEQSARTGSRCACGHFQSRGPYLRNGRRRLPFEGSTSSDVLVSILSEKDPPPLARSRRDVPAELERIVSKASAQAP